MGEVAGSWGGVAGCGDGGGGVCVEFFLDDDEAPDAKTDEPYCDEGDEKGLGDVVSAILGDGGWALAKGGDFGASGGFGLIEVLDAV